MEKLQLKFENNDYLRIKPSRFAKEKEELEIFLNDELDLQTEKFAKTVMFSHEIKTNNQIEGYNDDIKLIQDIINKKYSNSNSIQRKRILNLYYAYNYILNNKNIDKKSLKELYSILSKDLLDVKDKVRMGEYYRTNDVYIYNHGNLSKYPDKGIPSNKIDEYMNQYFEYLHNNQFNGSMTDEYIKSQILHYYFVYIHPYFDVNGRTSRTLSMWYLLNKEIYPYIIFNRGITFKARSYEDTIIDTKKYHDITFFIKYMLETVHEELEKEYIIEHIKKNCNVKLINSDYQTLIYFLSMNGLISANDFMNFYNRLNDHKKAKEIYEEMIYPLICKNIIKVVRTTNHNMFGNIPNEILEINNNYIDFDKNKIKKLSKRLN